MIDTEVTDVPPIAVESPTPLDIFSEQVAETIGGNITPERVANVIRASNEGGYIFHGVKHFHAVEKVKAEGVAPLTPEGMEQGSSFWTGGKSIFGTLTSSGKINTFDSTFFHYGHSEIQGGVARMAIVMTDKEALKKSGIEVDLPQDCYLEIDKPVPPHAFSFLEIEVPIPEGERLSRAVAQEAEEAMFGLIEHAVTVEYTPGRNQIIRLSGLQQAQAA